MLGPVSLLIGTATGPITRRLAGESADSYRSMLGDSLRSRPDVLTVALAWLVALIPWALLCIGIDALCARTGLSTGWSAPVTFAGIVAIGGAAVYYGLRGYLAREPIVVRAVEDAVPVLAFLVTASILGVSGAV